ncbi:uncharacterized protein LOC107813983 [Nicotiana tabacum]|uniref:Uncharacterized protein LOC107813983 n=1 Tax=Nicotiana tabacum TaxID=4097 RepID=A0A1S4C0V9_TOBAC|nr:PREDICTED: uncharacterized protein LOC107813983 [Nicotiana tabacum]
MKVDNEQQPSNITAASQYGMLQQLPPATINSYQFVDDQEEEGQLIMQIDNQHTIQQRFLLPSAMTSNNEDEENMEFVPIISDTIEKIAETSTASKKSRKRVRRKLKESPPCKILRHDALPEEVRVGSDFDNKKNMTKFFCSCEINQKVKFTIARSYSKRYELKYIVEKWSWNVRATKIKISSLFRVIKYHNNHECSVDARKSDQKHANSNFISEQILEHVRDKKIEVTPTFVESKMKKKFGIDIGYHKAWRAIQKAIASIRGKPEENYQILPSYIHMIVHRNLGTYTSIKRDEQNRFAYMFFSPAASIVGWCYCRPVIAVDAMFLKSKYRGVLFVAVSKDANNQIFPLSFGVANSENNDAYIWFFGEMRKAIQVRRELVFLSDRNQSIANGIRKFYPEAHHGICLYHFEKNLKQKPR